MPLVFTSLILLVTASIAAISADAVLGAVMAVNVAITALTLYRRNRLNLPTFATRWSLVDLWLGAMCVVFALVVLTTPLLLLVGIFSQSLSLGKLDLTNSDALAALAKSTAPAAIVAFTLPSAILQNVGFFVVPVAFINFKYKLPLRAIGLPPMPRWREVRTGVLLGLIALVASDFIGTGLHWLAEQFKSVDYVQHALDVEKTNVVAKIMTALPKTGPMGLILGILTVGVAAPLGEEMLFRGFVFNILKNRVGLGIALFVSALLFTVLHSYALGLLPVFLLGLLLAWAYHNTGSLWVSIIIHATNNTVGVLLAYFFPGLGV